MTSSDKIILIHKPPSWSPLQAIEKLRVLKPELADETLGYAGRLDPMAEGLLLILVGDECKRRTEYERLEKEYEFEVLLGIETDSYDVMGIVKNINGFEMKNEKLDIGPPAGGWKLEISQLLKSFIGSWDQPYPPYSSARVNGKPLFYWAREGKIDEINIPKKQISIHSIELNEVKEVKLKDIIPEIIGRIEKVQGEFRQEEILNRWKEVMKEKPELNLIKLSCTISCSSGTYVRSIAHELGKRLGTGGIAYFIKRTRIGEFALGEALTIHHSS
ncbi:hypothetical protein KBD81_01520 [Candidatus Woesebacteria bacterium]|nr:hypothetical protein [Candidatus Woesebacteria bacterium]